MLRQEQVQIYRHTLLKLRTVDEALATGASGAGESMLGMSHAHDHAEGRAASHMASSSTERPHAKRVRT